MPDQFVEVTDAPGCFQRIKNSFARVGIGFLLIVISFPLLFWNEGRTIKRAQDLEFGRGSVASVDAGAVDASSEGDLLHVTGKLTASKPAVDAELGISADAIGLAREVEMYQWTENKNTEKKGDKKVTTYTYEEQWSSTAHASGGFKKPGHDNPPMPLKSASFQSPSVKLGAFAVSPGLVADWPVAQEYALKPEQLSKLSKLHDRAPTLEDGVAHFGDPGSPEIGDLRIAYKIGPPGAATVVAGLQSGTLTAFTHPDMNGSIEMLTVGTKTADEMFQAAEDSNAMLKWILRVAGFLLMFIGFNLLFGPIDTFVRMIPLIGAVIDFGTTVIAFVLAGALSFITIAIGWIFYRPLIGLALLGIGFLFIGLGIFLAMKAKRG